MSLRGRIPAGIAVRRAWRGGALLLTLLLALLLPLPALADTFTGLCTAVHDGDTIEVLRAGAPVRVRLASIDAPERGQAFSDRAREHLGELLFGATVTVELLGTDRWGRQIGRVRVGDRDASEEMVRAGLAWQFTRYSSDPRLAALEREARAAARGLWVETRPLPPWAWRAEQARAASEGGERPSAGPFRGNTASHRFHRPGCEHYACRNCTDVFATREAALAAGYQPCGSCRP